MSSNSIVKIEVSDRLVKRAAKIAAASSRRIGPDRVIEESILKIVDDAEATSVIGEAMTVLTAKLTLHVEYPFVLVVYHGKIAGVAVDVDKARPDPRTFHKRDDQWGKFIAGGPLLVDWAPWFRGLMRRAGAEVSAC